MHDIIESLEDEESRQWAQQLADMKAQNSLPKLISMSFAQWCKGVHDKDKLKLLFDSVSPPVEPREPPVPVPLEPLVANVVVPPSHPDEDDALMNLCNVLGLVLVVGLCLLLSPSSAPTSTNSDIEGLAVRVRMAENTARRASLGAAVCLRILRNQTLVKMDKQDTLLSRAALLALSPAVSKAWAYVPMRRVAHCDCTSRLEFAKYKTITDARLEALELKTREQAERALALETQAKDQKIRVDALEVSFSTAALIWSMSAIGLAALVVTGAAPIVFAAQALAATTAGVGMALVEQNMV
jgi:hypothetical protein